MKAQALDKDGYIILTMPGWSTRDGRGTFYEPHGQLQGLILFLNMYMDKPVVDATGLKRNLRDIDALGGVHATNKWRDGSSDGSSTRERRPFREHRP